MLVYSNLDMQIIWFNVSVLARQFAFPTALQLNVHTGMQLCECDPPLPEWADIEAFMNVSTVYNRDKSKVYDPCDKRMKLMMDVYEVCYYLLVSTKHKQSNKILWISVHS